MKVLIGFLMNAIFFLRKFDLIIYKTTTENENALNISTHEKKRNKCPTYITRYYIIIIIFLMKKLCSENILITFIYYY